MTILITGLSLSHKSVLIVCLKQIRDLWRCLMATWRLFLALQFSNILKKLMLTQVLALPHHHLHVLLASESLDFVIFSLFCCRNLMVWIKSSPAFSVHFTFVSAYLLAVVVDWCKKTAQFIKFFNCGIVVRDIKLPRSLFHRFRIHLCH